MALSTAVISTTSTNSSVACASVISTSIAATSNTSSAVASEGQTAAPSVKKVTFNLSDYSDLKPSSIEPNTVIFSKAEYSTSAASVEFEGQEAAAPFVKSVSLNIAELKKNLINFSDCEPSSIEPKVIFSKAELADIYKSSEDFLTKQEIADLIQLAVIQIAIDHNNRKVFELINPLNKRKAYYNFESKFGSHSTLSSSSSSPSANNCSTSGYPSYTKRRKTYYDFESKYGFQPSSSSSSSASTSAVDPSSNSLTSEAHETSAPLSTSIDPTSSSCEASTISPAINCILG